MTILCCLQTTPVWKSVTYYGKRLFKLGRNHSDKYRGAAVLGERTNEFIHYFIEI